MRFRIFTLSQGKSKTVVRLLYLSPIRESQFILQTPYAFHFEQPVSIGFAGCDPLVD